MGYDFQPGFVQKYFEPHYGKEAFFFVTTLALPRTRGEVKLRSKDPFEAPLVDPKYFDVPKDLQILAEGNRTKASHKFWVLQNLYDYS